MYSRWLLLLFVFGAICAAQQAPYQLGPISVWEQERRIEVAAVVNMNRIDMGPIELLVTANGGKLHESVLVIPCKPVLLHTALGLIGLNPGGGGRYPGDPAPLFGDALYIYVSWQDSNGQKRTVRGEDLVWDAKHGQSMPHTHWVFTGSRTARNRTTGQAMFMANQQGVVVATYYDPDAVINNPLAERTDDTVYFANEKVVPPCGTKVNIVFTVVAYGE